ncbi:hypothetical protein KQ940_16230, partial [Marinobacterium sp. D7]|uniref:calcium-binding protein n=1 Tax=Marinobacterium ramblicola TaxID=2849041 RepID=UPI0024849CE6
VLGEGIQLSDLSAHRDGNNLVLSISDPADPARVDQITVENMYTTDKRYRIERLELADGSSLTVQQLFELATTEGTEADDTFIGTEFIDQIVAGGGNDTINTGDGNDRVDGGAGNDSISAGNGADVVSGGAGDDVIDTGTGNDRVDGGDGADQITASHLGSNVLSGDDGDDLIRISRSNAYRTDNAKNAAGYSNTLEGGTGNDRLEGWTGADTYVFNRGDGQDVISDYDYGYTAYYTSAQSSFGKTDRIVFGDDIQSEDLWFTRDENDLVIDTIGTDDQVRIENWYSSSVYQIESIEAADAVLTNNVVDQLVNAMASFDVPTGVGAIVPQDVQDQLAPVLAANWQSQA